MTTKHIPIIAVGQVFLNEDLNEYLIVSKNNFGQIYYAGPNFKGQSEVETFIERFAPVNPDDVVEQELSTLLSFCPVNTVASTGYIK